VSFADTQNPNNPQSTARSEPPNVYIEFTTEPKMNAEKTAEKGHNVYDDVDYVVWTKRGSNGMQNRMTITRCKRAAPEIWALADKMYDRWRETREMPVEGTALAMWPLISPAQVMNLQFLNLRTVEDVAGMTDADCDRVGMGARGLRDQAQSWLKTSADVGKSAVEMAEMSAEVRALRAERNELISRMREMKGEIDAMKPKRGRPPKVKGGDEDADNTPAAT